MSFTSARGKKIEVSEDALKKVQKLFAEDEEDHPSITLPDKKRKQDVQDHSNNDIISFQKPLFQEFHVSPVQEQKNESQDDLLNVIKTQPSNTSPFKTLSAKKPRGFVQPRKQEKTINNIPSPKPVVPKKTIENRTLITSLSDFSKQVPFYVRDHTQLLSCGLSSSVINVTSQNAAHFTFQNDWTLPFFTSSTIGVVEIAQALVSTGLDAKFCTLDWVTNHYKWIVWKLASMERSFPENFGGQYLTLTRVLEQLKHRYEREVNQAKRSIIKKIVERDEVSTKFMVLCVAKIMLPQTKGASESTEEGMVLELTDGWYGIHAMLDSVLTKHVLLGRIFVGQKLRIFGAELSGSDIAASPLEIGNSVMLKLHANGTRRAAWYSKLGLQKQQAFRVNLKSVVPDGGIIPCMEVVVQRQYPLLFIETLPDGNKVTRQIKDEEYAAQLHASQLSDVIAKRVDEQEKNWDARNRVSQTAKKPAGFSRPGFKAPRQSKVDINSLETGEELCSHMLETNTPRDAFMKKLSEMQQQLLQQYLDQKKQEDVMDSIQKIAEESTRTVVSLLKVKICDFIPQLHLSAKQTEAVLTIWRPAEELPQLFTEGSRLRVYGVAPVKQTKSGALTTTKYTRWKTMEKTDEVNMVFIPRQPISADGLRSLAINSEFDYVGKIVFVSESQSTVDKTGTTWNAFSVFVVDTTGELLQISMKNRREQKPIEGGLLVILNVLFKGRDEGFGIFQAAQLDQTQIIQSSNNQAFLQRMNEIQAWSSQNQLLIMQRRQYLIDLTQNNLAVSIGTNPTPKNSLTRFGSILPFCGLQWNQRQIAFSSSCDETDGKCERFHQVISNFVFDFDTGKSVTKIILSEEQLCNLLRNLSIVVPGFGAVNGLSVTSIIKYAVIIPGKLDSSVQDLIAAQLCTSCRANVATFAANKYFIQENSWKEFLFGLSHWLCQQDLQVCEQHHDN